MDFDEKVDRLTDLFEQIEKEPTDKVKDAYRRISKEAVTLLSDEDFEFMCGYMSDPRYARIYNVMKVITENMASAAALDQIKKLGESFAGDGFGKLNEDGEDSKLLDSLYGNLKPDDFGEPN